MGYAEWLRTQYRPVAGGGETPIIASSSANATGTFDTTGVVVSTPSDVQVGDLLLTIIGGSAANTAPVITPPAGWTFAAGGNDNTATQRAGCWAYFRIADGTEAGSYTWKGNATAGTATALGKCFRITGANSGVYQPFFVFDRPLATTMNGGATSNGTDATAETPAGFYTVVANDLVIAASCIAQSGAAQSVLTATPPSGFNEEADFGQALATTETSLTVDSRVVTTRGDLGSQTITWSGAPTLGSWASVILPIQAYTQSPVVRSSATATGTADATTGVTVSVPTNTADGDLLVACVSMSAVVTNGTTPPTITAPGGWTLIVSRGTANSNGTNRASRHSLYYRIASSEPANYKWTGNRTTAQGATGVIYRITGHDQTNPINANAPFNGVYTTGVTGWVWKASPGLVPTVSNCLVLGFVSAASDVVQTFGPDAGYQIQMREDKDFGTDPGDANSMTTEAQVWDQTGNVMTPLSAGGTGTSSCSYCSTMIAVAPPAPPPWPNTVLQAVNRSAVF